MSVCRARRSALVSGTLALALSLPAVAEAQTSFDDAIKQFGGSQVRGYVQPLADALVAGEIDALFEVAGAPAEIFRDARIDPESFHLLPLTEPVLRAVYAPAEVAAGTYPFAAGAVPVKMILLPDQPSNR
jgi:TRAP-type uncharacterized transport system substrate-binding protein